MRSVTAVSAVQHAAPSSLHGRHSIVVYLLAPRGEPSRGLRVQLAQRARRCQLSNAESGSWSGIRATDTSRDDGYAGIDSRSRRTTRDAISTGVGSIAARHAISWLDGPTAHREIWCITEHEANEGLPGRWQTPGMARQGDADMGDCRVGVQPIH